MTSNNLAYGVAEAEEKIRPNRDTYQMYDRRVSLEFHVWEDHPLYFLSGEEWMRLVGRALADAGHYEVTVKAGKVRQYGPWDVAFVGDIG